MPPRKPKPHQQAILDAYDAGERNSSELARRFAYEPSGIRGLLRRYGRQPRSLKQAVIDGAPAHSARMKALWDDPAYRARMSSPAISAAKSAGAAQPRPSRRDPWLATLSDEERYWYIKMQRSGVRASDARAAIDRDRAAAPPADGPRERPGGGEGCASSPGR